MFSIFSNFFLDSQVAVVIILPNSDGLFSVPAPLFDLLAGSSAGFFAWLGQPDLSAGFGLSLSLLMSLPVSPPQPRLISTNAARRQPSHRIRIEFLSRK